MLWETETILSKPTRLIARPRSSFIFWRISIVLCSRLLVICQESTKTSGLVYPSLSSVSRVTTTVRMVSWGIVLLASVEWKELVKYNNHMEECQIMQHCTAKHTLLIVKGRSVYLKLQNKKAPHSEAGASLCRAKYWYSDETMLILLLSLWI